MPGYDTIIHVFFSNQFNFYHLLVSSSGIQATNSQITRCPAFLQHAMSEYIWEMTDNLLNEKIGNISYLAGARAKEIVTPEGIFSGYVSDFVGEDISDYVQYSLQIKSKAISVASNVLTWLCRSKNCCFD